MAGKSSKRDGLASLQTLQGLSSKKKILDIHRRYLRVQQKDVQSDEEAETLWRQYLEFIVVKTHHTDTSGVGMKFSTTPEVDALWHTHLLNTESYHELMALVSNINPSVKFIHHSEENFLEPEAKKQEQRKAAAEAFKKTFGRECDWFNGKEKAKEKDEKKDTEDKDDAVYISSDDDGDSDSSEESNVRPLKVFLKTPGGRTLTLHVFPHFSIETVRWLIHEQRKLRSGDHLMFKGEILFDHRIVSDYNIQEESTLNIFETRN